MGRYVALLRGINVGGHRKLPMKRLVALFEGQGCTDVAHYIQSGNIVFSAPAPLAKRIPSVVATEIADADGFEVPVTVRSARQLVAVGTAHPFQELATDDKLLNVAFLGAKPTAKAAASLEPERSPHDRFEVRGREVFLYFSKGTSKTKFTNDYLERRLGVVSTVRGWRTVRRLVEMVGA